MSNTRNLAGLLNSSGNVPDAKLVALAATKLTGQVPDANAPSGSVIQVVSATYDTKTEITGSASGVFSDTGLQAIITPMSASSKILVLFSCNGVAARLGSFHQEPDLRLVRNGGEIKFYENLLYAGGNDFWIPGIAQSCNFSATFLDSPSTTSAVTYKIQIRGNTSIAGDMRVAINSRGDGGSGNGGGGSSMTLVEVTA
jgi:hypothetical protein